MLTNMARLAEDMGKAKNIVGDAVHSIEKVLGALGIGFGAHELIEKINTVAEGMDKLMTASEKTGASVEALSKLQFFAGVSGSNLDSVTGALVKLAKGESEAGNETGKFAQALKVLNLSSKDSAGELKDPSVLYGEIAQKLFGYADGAGKTAIAVALMGKAGADQLPTMKKMVELGDIEASVTREQAAAAEEYGIEMAKLARQKEILWQTVTSALLPSMQTFIGVLIDAGKQSDSLGGKAKQLAGDGSIESWADASAMGIARFIDVLKAALQLLSATIASAKVVANDLEKPAKHLALIAAWATPGSGVTKEQGDQMWKEQLDEYAKDLADANQKYANLYDSDKTAFSRAVEAKIALRKAAELFKATEQGASAAKPQLKFDLGDPKLAAAELKQYQGVLKQLENELGRLNNQTEVGKLTFELYGKNVNDADGKMIHLDGSLEKITPKHAKVLLMLAAEVDKRKAVVEVLKAEIANMEEMDKLYQAQAAIRLASFQADKLYLEDLQFQIDLIGKTVVEQGKMNEMRKIDLKLRADLKAAAAVAGDDMTGFQATTDLLYARAEEQKAAVLGSVAVRLKAERDWLTGANAAINDYVDHATNAAEASKAAFTNAFKNMEDALVVFMQTGKLNFKNLADSIIADIIRIQVRQSITGPLAKELPGAISWLTSLLGPSTQAPAPVVDAIFKAEGGPVSSGSPYVVGENGPEMFVPRSSGNIIPNDALGGRTTVTNIFHLSGATDTRSQAQISAAAGQGVQRAMARNT